MILYKYESRDKSTYTYIISDKFRSINGLSGLCIASTTKSQVGEFSNGWAPDAFERVVNSRIILKNKIEPNISFIKSTNGEGILVINTIGRKRSAAVVLKNKIYPLALPTANELLSSPIYFRNEVIFYGEEKLEEIIFEFNE